MANAKAVKIMVVDDKGYGVAKQQVRVYQGDTYYTNDDGLVTLVIDTTDVTIFIGKFTAYSGKASYLDAVEVFNTLGKRP